MKIILSNKIAEKRKELIINSIFEIQEGMPQLVDFFNPIYSLLQINTNANGFPVKACGPNLISPGSVLEKNLLESIVSDDNGGEGPGIFSKSIRVYLSNEISKSKSDIIIMNNPIKERVGELLSVYKKIYYIGPENDPEMEGAKRIEVDYDADYDSIKDRLTQFFTNASSLKSAEMESSIKTEEKIKAKGAVSIEKSTIYNALRQVRESLLKKRSSEEGVAEQIQEKAEEETTKKNISTFDGIIFNRYRDLTMDDLENAMRRSFETAA